MRKIGFLGVVIGPNGIKMEEKKVDGVLSWPDVVRTSSRKRFPTHLNTQTKTSKVHNRVKT